MLNTLKKYYRPAVPLLLAVIAAVTVICYAPSLQNGFVNIVDDDAHLCRNAGVHSLSPESAGRLFTSSCNSIYIPLTQLSYAVEFRLFGLVPVAYHIDNLLLHIANALLVFWLFFKLSGRRPTAFIVALLFALHPLHVESVAWVTERKDVLYAFFFLFSFVMYVQFTEKRNPVFYVLSLLLFLLSMLAKGMAVTLPLLLLLYDWWRSRGPGKTAWLEKIPYFVLAAFVAAANIAAHREFSSGAVASVTGLLVQQSWELPYRLAFYLYKLFLPLNLSCYYTMPASPSGIPAAGILSIIFCIALAAAVLYSLRYTRVVMFASLFYLFVLLPVLNLLPFGMETVADRYAYIAPLGIFFLLAKIFVRWYDRAGRRPLLQAVLITAVLVPGVVLGALTYDRCRVWRDDVTLLQDALDKGGPDAYVYTSLSKAYTARGEYSRAAACAGKAVALKDTDPRCHRALGDALFALGDFGSALDAYRRTVQLNPRDIETHSLLIDALDLSGNPAEAEKLFARSCADGAVPVEMMVRMGVVYARRGKTDRAESMLLKVIKHDRHNAGAYYNLGVLYLSRGKKETALAAFRRAAEAGFAGKEVYNNIGALAMESGADRYAMEAYRQSLRIDDQCAFTWYNLGNLYGARGRYREARDAYEKAALLEAGQEDPLLLYNMGIVYAQLGEYEKALQRFERLKGMPSNFSTAVAENIARVKNLRSARLGSP